LTLVQTQQRLASPAPMTMVDDRDVSGPRVREDMTVEVALSVMAGAQVGHLLVCDGDELCTGLITRAQLTVVRDSPAYTDRIRVADVLRADGPGALTLSR
jgi:CBS domain-containing protein